MGLFADRQEHDGKVTITYSTVANVVWVASFFVPIILSLPATKWGNLQCVSFNIAMLLTLGRILSMRKLNSEIWRAMKVAEVRVQGSRWSTTDPLRFTFPASAGRKKA